MSCLAQHDVHLCNGLLISELTAEIHMIARDMSCLSVWDEDTA